MNKEKIVKGRRRYELEVVFDRLCFADGLSPWN